MYQCHIHASKWILTLTFVHPRHETCLWHWEQGGARPCGSFSAATNAMPQWPHAPFTSGCCCCGCCCDACCCCCGGLTGGASIALVAVALAAIAFTGSHTGQRHTTGSRKHTSNVSMATRLTISSYTAGAQLARTIGSHCSHSCGRDALCRPHTNARVATVGGCPLDPKVLQEKQVLRHAQSQLRSHFLTHTNIP